MKDRAVRHLAVSGAVLVVCLCTLAWLARVGPRARSMRSAAPGAAAVEVEVVDTSGELLELWRRGGARGRRWVHASRYLHFVPVEAESWFAGLDRFPVRTFDLVERYERSVDARNLLWVSMQAGIARAVHHVLPPEVLEAKLAQIGGAGGPERRSPRQIVAHEHGSPRVITDRFPRIAEPVLLSVDASYLDSLDVPSVVARLRESGLLRDRVILCRSRDNPDVAESARLRLEELRSVLEAGVE